MLPGILGGRKGSPMNRIFSSLLAFALFLGFGTVASQGHQSGGRSRAKIDVSKLGPQVGERVPDFKLPDQIGQLRTIQSIMGPRGALLVFIRSADW